MGLTNEQAEAISRAHFNLKATRHYIVEPQTFDDVTYAIKELEKVFTWLNIYQAAHKEDE